MWSLLISVSTEVEADIIKGLLDQSQILVQKKYPLGSLKDSYGIVTEVELWVPTAELDQARVLINTLLQDSKTIGIDQDRVEGEEEPEPMYKTNSTINHQAQSKVNVPFKSLLAILLALVLIIYWLIKGSEIF